MSSATLALSAFADLAIAAAFVAVAWRFGAGHAGSSRAAVRAFQVWWAGIGFTVFVNAAREGIAAVGLHTTPAALVLFEVLQYGYYLALCAAVWGLLAYLAYLYTGRIAWLGRLGVFYGAYAALAFLLVARMDLTGVTPGKWFVQWSYAAPTQGALLVVLVLLLLVPQILAAVAYLSLRRSVADPVSRARIPRVAWPLIAWLAITLLAPFLQLGRFELWQAGGRLVGLAAALLILHAYRTPIAGLDLHQGLAGHAEERQAAQRKHSEAIAGRARELV